jgi:hypothetical protein
MMSKERKVKRQSSRGQELFDKLFNRFSADFIDNSQFREGLIYTDSGVWTRFDALDRQWKRFTNNAQANREYIVSFKHTALMDKAKNYVEQITSNVWALYLSAHINRKYGFFFDKDFLKGYLKGHFTNPPDPKDVIHSIITQHMNKIEIPDIHFRVNIPSQLEEMTKEQYLFYSERILQFYNKDISMTDFLTYMAMKFLGIRFNRRKYNLLRDEEKLQVCDNMNRVTELLGYFFQNDEQGHVTLNLSCVKNFIPDFRRGLFRYSGPADALTDITFLEYKDANHFYTEYSVTKEESALDNLVAVLYRPRRFRKKVPYNGNTDKRAKAMHKLPYPVKFGIYLFYASCEKFLREGSFKADQADINLRMLYETTPKEQRLKKKDKWQDQTGLSGLAISLAQTGIFGKLDDVYRQNLYDVLVLLYKQRIDYLNQIENMNV